MNKVNSIIDNITEIMKLEMLCASSVLADTYPGAAQLFASPDMELAYKPLEKALTSEPAYKTSAEAVDKWWVSGK